MSEAINNPSYVSDTYEVRSVGDVGDFLASPNLPQGVYLDQTEPNPEPDYEAYKKKPISEWTPFDAEVARTAEWNKFKGPTAKLVVDEQLGNEGPSVTADSTYAVFTGHGEFDVDVNGNPVASSFEYKEGRLNVWVVTNKTNRPLNMHGKDFPTGGTSIAEYNSGMNPMLDALAVLPLIDPVNHHCGVDCNEVVIEHVVVQPAVDGDGYITYKVRFVYEVDENGKLVRKIDDIVVEE